MGRIFGFAVSAIWLVFALFAFRSSAAGWTAGHTDLGFWWAVITFFLAAAATVALVGTLRYSYQGPAK
jgi:hypothetical protein